MPSSSDQQALEALAVLVALREWAPVWRDQRVSLLVRTDNVAALSLIVRMQPHSETLGIIAREMALDISHSSYSPDEAAHIPGLANVAADKLSRVFDPKSPSTLPPYLEAHVAHKFSARPGEWWRSLSR